MSDSLSPIVEQLISDAVSAGAYLSRKAMLEAAVLEMRAAQGDETARMELCEQAISEYEAGYRVEWNPDELKRRLREAFPDESRRKPA